VNCSSGLSLAFSISPSHADSIRQELGQNGNIGRIYIQKKDKNVEEHFVQFQEMRVVEEVDSSLLSGLEKILGKWSEIVTNKADFMVDNPCQCHLGNPCICSTLPKVTMKRKGRKREGSESQDSGLNRTANSSVDSSADSSILDLLNTPLPASGASCCGGSGVKVKTEPQGCCSSRSFLETLIDPKPGCCGSASVKIESSGCCGTGAACKCSSGCCSGSSISTSMAMGECSCNCGLSSTDCKSCDSAMCDTGFIKLLGA
jgi:hypothetical protein